MKRRDERSRSVAERSGWPVRRYRLGEEPPENQSAATTATERIAMMWPLACEAWESRETADLDGTPVFFLGRQALIASKRASGRLKDLADVERLEGPGDR